MAPPQSDVLGWWSLAAQVTTWVIVLGGWIVVNRQNNGRERRKEIRQAIDKIASKIDEIERSALTFHQNEYKAESAIDLQLAIAKTIRAIERLGIVDQITYSRNAIQFRKAITLKNFDATNHVPLTGTETQLAEISTAAQDLVDAIESGYTKRYLR